MNFIMQVRLAVFEQIRKEMSDSTTTQDKDELLALASEFWSRRDLRREFSWK